jgi:hypothetical protein
MYKIIKNNKVLDVIEYADFIRFLPTGRVARTCIDLAEGVIGSDEQTIYSFGSNTPTNVAEVRLESITLEEFNRLKSLLNSNVNTGVDTHALTQAQDSAINRLSDICKNKIIAGFSIRLSGALHNFKLTTEDQLNLLSLENQFNSGATTFVYHATNEPCRVFMRKDMEHIIKAFRKHTLYHTTYFNVAKQYIKSLVDIDEINNFTYGTDLAGKVTDPIIRRILREGGAAK